MQRINYYRDRIHQLIVTVSDITNQKKLAIQLEETESQQKKQMEWLLSILHVEAPMLQEFMDSAKEQLSIVSKLLHNSDPDKTYKSILEEIYRSIHLIKGNAALLDMKFLSEKAHEFEEQIEQIRKRKSIYGGDFVPLVLRLSEFKNIFLEVNNLIERIGNIQTHFRPKRSYENNMLIRSLKNLVNTVAEDHNKKVDFVYEGFVGENIPYRYRLTVKEVLIQLIRNAVVHGIEEPEERIQLGKPEEGLISLTTNQQKEGVEIILRDDGRGLQIDSLRKKAVQENYISPKKAEQLPEDQIAELIFEQGISTATETTLNAGRGVGMNIIRDRIEKSGGIINVNYKENKFCEFRIILFSNENQISETKDVKSISVN